MRKIVIDDPFAPEQACSIQIIIERSPTSGLCRSGWSWIKGYPAVLGKIRFNPTVRVPCAHHEVLADGVVSSRLESVHNPGRHAQGAEHQRHCGCKVDTVALARLEKETVHRINRRNARRIETVVIVASKVILNGQNAVVIIGGRLRNSRGERREFRIRLRKREIAETDLLSVILPGAA